METNPYSPPSALLDATFFATEARNATLRELWRMTPPTIGGKLIAILVKTLRLTGPPQIGFAFNDVVRCSPSDVPELQEYFEDDIATLKHLGFEPALAMTIPVIGNGHGSALAFLGNDATVFGIVVHCEVNVNGKLDGDSGLSFVSRNSNTIWPTTNMVQRLANPPMFNAIHLVGRNPSELYAGHCDRMRSISNTSLRRFTNDVLWNTLREHESMIREFNLDRGVFRPMTIAELESLSQNNSTEQKDARES